MVTMILIVIGALGMIHKSFLSGLKELKIRRLVDTIQTTDRPEYWEESWRLEETCCHSDTSERPSANSDVKNTNNNNNNDDNNNNNKHDPAPVLENDTHKLPWDFNIQTYHLIPARRPDLIIINKKKRICKIVDFAVAVDHRINLKESEKKDKYLDLARELKNLWNMKVTTVPIVIGALGTITKGLLKGLEGLEVGGRVETIQMTALLKTARILRRVLETWGNLLSLTPVKTLM